MLIKRPGSAFNLFISDDVLNLICEHTNSFATDPSFEIDLIELHKYIGVLISKRVITSKGMRTKDICSKNDRIDNIY